MRNVDIRFLQDMYKEAMSCPRASGDVELNTKNRDKTIKTHNYGPLNLNDEGYWEVIADKWDTTPDVAKKSKCGNCVAFDVSPRMDECMPGPVSDGEGKLGYCWMHHFKCHSARTCNTWAKGGPITKDAASEDWQSKSKGMDKESSAVMDTAMQTLEPHLPNTGREGASAGALGGLLAGGLFSVPMSYAARKYGIPLSPYAAPAVGAVAGGIGGKILGEKRSQTKTASSEYDDSHMLSKILERMSAQSAHLKEKIDAGLVIPSWAEYKLYNAYSNLGSALGTAYPGEYEKEAAAATKTNPQLWEKSKQQAKARMGGKHSARAMQLATKIYKGKGGGYSGSKPSSKNNSLKKWSKQKWGYSGKDKPGQGGSGVYLPEAKRKRLKSTKQGRKQLAAATRKKHKATSQGKQYSSHGLASGTSLKKTATLIPTYFEYKKARKKRREKKARKMMSMGKYASSSRVKSPNSYYNPIRFTAPAPPLESMSTGNDNQVMHQATQAALSAKSKSDAASVSPPPPPQPLKPSTALVEPPFRPRYTGM